MKKCQGSIITIRTKWYNGESIISQARSTTKNACNWNPRSKPFDWYLQSINKSMSEVTSNKLNTDFIFLVLITTCFYNLHCVPVHDFNVNDRGKVTTAEQKIFWNLYYFGKYKIQASQLNCWRHLFILFNKFVEAIEEKTNPFEIFVNPT